MKKVHKIAQVETASLTNKLLESIKKAFPALDLAIATQKRGTNYHYNVEFRGGEWDNLEIYRSRAEMNAAFRALLMFAGKDGEISGLQAELTSLKNALADKQEEIKKASPPTHEGPIDNVDDTLEILDLREKLEKAKKKYISMRGDFEKENSKLMNKVIVYGALEMDHHYVPKQRQLVRMVEVAEMKGTLKRFTTRIFKVFREQTRSHGLTEQIDRACEILDTIEKFAKKAPGGQKMLAKHLIDYHIGTLQYSYILQAEGVVEFDD
jgi:protein tyrosine phosphatase (PTP) superfamily phosphohydrolase (DUF442 family)